LSGIFKQKTTLNSVIPRDLVQMECVKYILCQAMQCTTPHILTQYTSTNTTNFRSNNTFLRN